MVVSCYTMHYESLLDILFYTKYNEIIVSLNVSHGQMDMERLVHFVHLPECEISLAPQTFKAKLLLRFSSFVIS